MNEHAHPLSMSERADELEEAKMHEMERIITKSTIAHLMDGEVKMDTSPEMKARHPGKYFLMGDDPRRRAMGAAGLAHAQAHFTIGEMLDRMEAVFRNVVSGHRVSLESRPPAR